MPLDPTHPASQTEGDADLPRTTPSTTRIILNAGLPKTATTSIQNTLFRNRRVLFEDTGVYYPGDEPNHTNALCTAFLTDPRNHIANRMAGRTDLDALKARAADIRDAFAAEIAETRPETVLFSAEGMSNLNTTELAAFRDWALGIGAELSVLYVVREPLRYATSVIQQHLKGGEVLEDMYENPPLPNFRGRLGSAIATFGKDRMQVRTFEDMVRHPDGVTGFFLDCIGVIGGEARAAIVADQTRENESLSHEAALILSSLNRQRPAFVDGERGPRRTLNELPQIEQIRGDRFRLPHHVRDMIRGRTAEDVAWLSETFGIDAYDTPEPPQTTADLPELPRDTIDSMANLLSNLINDRHVNALIQRARTIHRQPGSEEELRRLAQEIARISPGRPLPAFLTEPRDD